MDQIDALRAAQDKAVQRLAQAWEVVAKAAARSPVPGSRETVEGVQQLASALTNVATSAAEPLRNLVEGQRELADRLERWAEVQRDSADVIAALAKQQRFMADLLSQSMLPFVPKRNSSG